MVTTQEELERIVEALRALHSEEVVVSHALTGAQEARDAYGDYVASHDGELGMYEISDRALQMWYKYRRLNEAAQIDAREVQRKRRELLQQLTGRDCDAIIRCVPSRLSTSRLSI